MDFDESFIISVSANGDKGKTKNQTTDNIIGLIRAIPSHLDTVMVVFLVDFKLLGGVELIGRQQLAFSLPSPLRRRGQVERETFGNRQAELTALQRTVDRRHSDGRHVQVTRLLRDEVCGENSAFKVALQVGCDCLVLTLGGVGTG